MTPDEQQDEQFYRDTESIAFPKLDDRQLSLLEPIAERRVLKRGELAYKAGQRDLGLTIVLSKTAKRPCQACVRLKSSS